MRLIVSLFITLALAVPIAYVAAPWVHRQVRIGWLTSHDLSKRQRGLSYLVAHAPRDVRVFNGAIDALTDVDDVNFQQIVDALQAAGLWDRTRIPIDPWLRWIGLQAKSPGVEAPALAAQRLAALQDHADDPRISALLSQLSDHPEPDVRYNTLCAAAELVLSANDQTPYQHLITGLQADAQPLIAHHASLLAYLIHAPGAEAPVGFELNVGQSLDERFDRQAIENLLHSPDAPLRDVGCVLAARDLNEADVSNLIAELLNDPDGRAPLAGAILVGMTGLHTDLLRQRIAEQTDWAAASVMKLGLWMLQGDVAEAVQPYALLAHGDVPRTTILLALLHRHDAQAWEVLLNPTGEAPSDLNRLLENYGWGHVLNRSLPNDAPHWRPGRDPNEQDLYINLLRDWYLLNRRRLSSLQSSS